MGLSLTPNSPADSFDHARQLETAGDKTKKLFACFHCTYCSTNALMNTMTAVQ